MLSIKSLILFRGFVRPPTLKKLEWEHIPRRQDGEFKVIPSYVVNLKVTCATCPRRKERRKKELNSILLRRLSPLPTLVDLGLDLNLVTFVEGLKEEELRAMELVSWCCQVA